MHVQIQQPNYEKIRDDFLTELSRAAQGKKTSLLYITTTLPKNEILQRGKFQAMVIGGTHYHTQIAERHPDGSISHISAAQKGDVPQFATKEIFFETIAKLLHPSITYLSLNLAYPLYPMIRKNQLDGKLAYGTKDHTFKDLLGKLIGEAIEDYIKESQGRRIYVVIANDTVCLVLAGLQTTSHRENLVGCIVGSGYNISLFLDAHTVVNLECASFDNFEQTQTGKQIDAASLNPGRGLFEKEVSGFYLYQHFNLLSKQFGLKIPPLHETKQLSMIAAVGNGQAKQIARALLFRSASLVAAQLAAIYLFKGKPSSLEVITEGSVLKQGWQYKQMIGDALQKLGVHPEAITFLQNKDSSLVGATQLLIQ